MNPNAFLDLIFPTKNRWHLIEPTFISLLEQTNKDFNLLVVDNSDTEEQAALAKKLLDKYKDKLSIKYYKTGGLNMLDNWDKGYALSDARYCYLITDKIMLIPQAVALFASGTAQFPDCNTFLFSSSGPKQWEQKDSAQLLTKTLDKMDHFYTACGGSELKPFLKREYKNTLIEKYGRLIHFVGGDVDVIYLALMNNPHYATYNEQIVSHNGNVGSVGRSGEYGGAAYLKYLEDHHLDYHNLYPHAPVNIPNNFNGMYNDLFATAKLCNYPCQVEQINKINYIIDLYISLIRYSRIYSIHNDEHFRMLHNYIERNNLQFHPEINRCLWFYGSHYTLKDYRMVLFSRGPAKHRKISKLLENIFSVKKEGNRKTVRLFGFPVYSKN